LLAAGAFIFWVRRAPERHLAQRERAWHTRISPGDLVFQDLDCGLRCQLIREVTHSRYSHVGIVLDEGGERFVWEALGPVGRTPLALWLERGRERRVAVYRLPPELAPRLPEIAAEVRRMGGLQYDGDYQWDDERIYCSELIAKAVVRATGVELAPPSALGPGGFGSHGPQILRLSKGRLTEQTPMVTPAALARAPGLVRIADELAGD
jgi:hypothetical protein